MRSLILYEKNHIITDDNQNKLRNISADSNLYTLSQAKNGFHLQFLNKDQVLSEVHLQGNNLVDYQFLRVERKIFIATKHKIILCSDDLKQQQHLSFPKAVRTVCWNYNQDALALYYEEGTIACVTIDIENCAFAKIYQESANTVSRVDVGWGSESTQFKGKRVKKEVKKVEYVCTDEVAVIDWRNNSEMFVVGYFDGEHRRIKVFRKNCELLYCSTKDNLLGLEIPLAFRPSGNLISGVVSTDGVSQEIVLLEVNPDLEIRSSLKVELKVRHLQWSPCSNFLTVWQQTNTSGYIDIYASSNAIWSVKQRLKLSNENKLISYSCVNSAPRTLSLELHFSTSTYRYIFVHKIVRCEKHSENLGLISVTNTNSVNIYNPQLGVIPPGVDEAHQKLQFDKFISTVIFDEFLPRLAVIDIDNHVSIYNYYPEWIKTREFDLENLDSTTPMPYHTVYFTKSGLVVVTVDKRDSGVQFTYDLTTVDGIMTPDKLSCESNIFFGGHAKSNTPPLLLNTIPNGVPIISVYYINYDEQFYSICLTVNEELTINGTIIRGHFSSMIRHDSYLLLTAKKHDVSNIITDYLLCIKLDADLAKQLLDGADIYQISYIRYVEKGSILLTSVSGTSRIMMQLPRGNIETIEFRGIAISTLNNLLSAENIEEAYNMIKYQSLGLDLMVDLHPDLFLKNLQKICTDIFPPNVMNKFLIEIRNESSLDQNDLAVISPKAFPNKRKTVCSAVLNILLACPNPQDCLTTIVIAGLCCTIADYDPNNAFFVLHRVCKGKYKKFKKNIIQAIEYLNNYIVYQDQYTIALSLYNLNLAEYIAEKSNMDPQFYLVYLQQMKASHECKTRFNINDSLGLYNKAVLYLIVMCEKHLSDYRELLNYAKSKKCIKILYNNIDKKCPIYNEVTYEYANLLAELHMYQEPAVLMFSIQQFQAAFNLYMKGNLWQEALTCTYLSNIPEVKQKMQIKMILRNLKQYGLYEQAARVHMDCFNDFDNAAVCLLEAHNYKEFIRLIFSWHSKNLVEKKSYFTVLLIPHLLEHIGTLNESFEETVKLFTNYFKQLLEWQPKPESSLVIEQDTEFADAFSDIHSVKTTSTHTSSRSSLRHAKRQMRKFLDTRKGSPFENIALMAKLHNIITESFKLCNEIIECYEILDIMHHHTTEPIQFVRIKTSKQIYKLIKSYETHVQMVSAEIWPEVLKNGVEAWKLVNIQHLESKYRSKPDKMEVKHMKLYELE